MKRIAGWLSFSICAIFVSQMLAPTNNFALLIMGLLAPKKPITNTQHFSANSTL